ncbi:unnamed protein product, partial [Sphacelaria rigidula]
MRYCGEPASSRKAFASCSIDRYRGSHPPRWSYTAHLIFKLPLGDEAVEDSVCNAKAESERANVLKRASLIIWDEVVITAWIRCLMSSKYSPEALNLTLQDLCHNDLPFHGKTIFSRGDWRQVTPVLKFGSAAE